MRVVVIGGTGVLGRAATPALLADGHEVAVVCRTPQSMQLAGEFGARPVQVDLFDVPALAAALSGADAVVNLASRFPVGYLGLLRSAWRRNDELFSQGVACVVEAARLAGVRRVVQHALSSSYADQGEEWITEQSPLEIMAAVEPFADAESHVQGYTCESRVGVILRFGQVTGDDPITRYWFKAAAHGRPVGVGAPTDWAHLIHTDDIGSAVVASLVAPAGIYNVGIEPIRKQQLVEAYAAGTGVEAAGFLGPVLRRMAGPRLEPVARSLRVCSEHFCASTGWRPSRPVLDASWFDAVAREAVPA